MSARKMPRDTRALLGAGDMRALDNTAESLLPPAMLVKVGCAAGGQGAR